MPISHFCECSLGALLVQAESVLDAGVISPQSSNCSMHEPLLKKQYLSVPALNWEQSSPLLIL